MLLVIRSNIRSQFPKNLTLIAVKKYDIIPPRFSDKCNCTQFYKVIHPLKSLKKHFSIPTNGDLILCKCIGNINIRIK